MRSSADLIIQRALEDGRRTLLEHEAKRICNEYHIDTPESRLVRNASEATLAARRLGFPVVLKILSPDILHKTEAGCVIVDLRTASDVRRAFRRILDNAKKHDPNAGLQNVLIEKMKPPGIEAIIGALRDPQFGLALMFGLGGVFVELFEDISFRVAPITERSARRMIREVKGYEILKGYRGREPGDEESLARILLSVSKIMTDHLEIDQMDLNPTIVYRNGAVVVDARMTLSA